MMMRVGSLAGGMWPCAQAAIMLMLVVMNTHRDFLHDTVRSEPTPVLVVAVNGRVHALVGGLWLGVAPWVCTRTRTCPIRRLAGGRKTMAAFCMHQCAHVSTFISV